MAGLVPAPIIVVERFGDVPGAALYPEEEAAIARAVPKRRNEFTTVRHCARMAMAALGVEPCALVPGPSGAPTWPSGVVGSMTHCAGYRAAAVARSTDIATLGIDAEPHEPLPAGMLRRVGCGSEQGHLAQLAADFPAICWDRVLFSAKESVYKAWFLLTRRWLGFDETELTFDPVNGRFEVALLNGLPEGVDPLRIHGLWAISDDFIATAVTGSFRRRSTTVTDEGNY